MTSTFYVRCCAAYASDSLAQEDLQLTFSLPKTVTHVPSLGVTHVVSCSEARSNRKRRVVASYLTHPVVYQDVIDRHALAVRSLPTLNICLAVG